MEVGEIWKVFSFWYRSGHSDPMESCLQEVVHGEADVLFDMHLFKVFQHALV